MIETSIEDSIPTERLCLEPLGRVHAKAMFQVLGDPALHKYTGGFPPASEQALEERYVKLETRRSADGSEWWLNWILLLDGSGPIGYVQASVAGDHAEIAWVVGVPWQGNGYAGESARALAQWLRVNGISKITACVNPKHIVSQRVASHAGLEETEELSESEVVWAWSR